MPSLEEVDQFPLPKLLIPRIVEVHHYSQDDAENLVREAKRMLYLRVVSNEGISPSLQIDDAWHEMLMFTRFYKKFADFIGRFVHHEPTEGPPDDGKVYEKTRENYKKYFGIEADRRYWKD